MRWRCPAPPPTWSQAPLGLVLDVGPPQLQPLLLQLHIFLENPDVGGTRRRRRGKLERKNKFKKQVPCSDPTAHETLAQELQ